MRVEAASRRFLREREFSRKKAPDLRPVPNYGGHSKRHKGEVLERRGRKMPSAEYRMLNAGIDFSVSLRSHWAFSSQSSKMSMAQRG